MASLAETNASIAVPAKERPTAPIVLPFAALGLVGGGLTGSLTHHAEMTAGFALVTMTSAAVLGGWLEHHRRTHGSVSGTRLSFATLLAGCINGALLLIWAVFPIGSLVGSIVGVFFAVPFVPAFWLVMRWGQEVGVAREGSLVDRAHRRGPMAAAAAVIALATLFAFVGNWRLVDLSVLRACAGLATGLAAVIVGLDVRAHMVARRAAHALGLASSPMDLELGVGDDVTIEHPPELAYRAPSTLVRICGGDPYLASVHLREQLWRHALSLGITLCVVAVHVLSPTARANTSTRFVQRVDAYCAGFMSFSG